MTKSTIVLLAAALSAAPLAAGAQSAAPEPAASAAPMASSMPMPAPSGATAGGNTSGTPVTPKPETTASPAPSTSSASGETQRGATAGTANRGKHLGQVKQLKSGSLKLTDLRYALTHPAQEAKKASSVKTISFDKLRVYRLSSSLKSLLKVGAIDRETAILAELSPAYEVAQTNGSNSPIAYLQYVLANINVSNALNNVSVLNNSTVNVGVTLADVLNNNKISIGQVAGIFVDGLGVITTITK
jgi:hypothetical protein